MTNDNLRHKLLFDPCFRFDLDFWEWVIEIDWYSYWHAMYVVMVAMILHALNSLISGYATFNQNRFLLGFSLFLR